MKCKKGYKQKGNKCVKKSTKRLSKKKSYNPLNMWGSWIGGFLLNIIPLPFCWLGGCSWVSYGYIAFMNMPKSLLVIPFLFLFGFLIGWGIHSLARKLKK